MAASAAAGSRVPGVGRDLVSIFRALAVGEPKGGPGIRGIAGAPALLVGCSGPMQGGRGLLRIGHARVQWLIIDTGFRAWYTTSLSGSAKDLSGAYASPEFGAP